MAETISSRISRGINSVSNELFGIISACLKLSLLILFSWYFWEFSFEWQNATLAQFAILAPVGVLWISVAYCFIAGLASDSGQNSPNPNERGQVWPFWLLLAVPILLIGIVSYADSSKVLQGSLSSTTQNLIKGLLR